MTYDAFNNQKINDILNCTLWHYCVKLFFHATIPSTVSNDYASLAKTYSNAYIGTSIWMKMFSVVVVGASIVMY